MNLFRRAGQALRNTRTRIQEGVAGRRRNRSSGAGASTSGS